MADWSFNIDYREYQPVPDSWIEAGIDRDGVGPQCLAVSASVLRQFIKVRYAHPTGTKVGAVSYPSTSGEGGSIPRCMVDGSWPRSIAAGRLEPIGQIRIEEREYLPELWDGRLADLFEGDPEVDPDDQRLIADGGVEWFLCALCGAEYRGRGAALGCCSERFSDKLVGLEGSR